MTEQKIAVSDHAARMQSALYLVLNDLREQAAGRPSRFTFDGTASELQDMIGQLEFTLLPDSIAIEATARET